MKKLFTIIAFIVISTVNAQAPQVWHVPSDAEWSNLTTFLGGVNVAGGKMKATTLWSAPNTAASNSSGFKGLPGGWRYANFGAFEHMGAYGVWWSSSEVETIKAVGYLLSYYFGHAIYYDEQKTLGYSVRCLKD